MTGFSSKAALAAAQPAADAPTGTARTQASPSSDFDLEPGQSAYAEFTGHAGTFLGLRGKGLVYSGDGFNLAVEGMYGSSYFGQAIFSKTYGGGLRSEIYVFTRKKQALMISPGVDGYYVPAHSIGEPPKDDGSPFSGLGYAIGDGLLGVPSRVVLVAPNVDVNYLFQAARHFGLVAGAKVGAAVALNGTDKETGGELKGKIFPDMGLYVGGRF